jgi:hypothetical protein
MEVWLTLTDTLVQSTDASREARSGNPESEQRTMPVISHPQKPLPTWEQTQLFAVAVWLYYAREHALQRHDLFWFIGCDIGLDDVLNLERSFNNRPLKPKPLARPEFSFQELDERDLFLYPISFDSTTWPSCKEEREERNAALAPQNPAAKGNV